MEPTVESSYNSALYCEYSRAAASFAVIVHADDPESLMNTRYRNLQILLRNKVCADIALFDRVLLKRALEFYTTVGEFLVTALRNSPLTDSFDFSLPTEVPNVFAALPEWFVEDIAEFLLFALQ